MKTETLQKKILFSFFLVIGVMGLSIALLRTYVIKVDIIDRAQTQVKNDLKAARAVFDNELDMMQKMFSMLPAADRVVELKDRLGLDYLRVATLENKARLLSDVARLAFSGRSLGASRIIDKEELLEIGAEFFKRSEIEIRFTQQAKSTTKKILDKAMALEYAMPVINERGQVTSVIYGGKIINRDFALVDKIRDLVFENKLYDAKPLGTVTIFLDDVRITTNVLDAQGNRAIGTRVSERVYDTVVKRAKSWVDRAFVVTDWYLTAYEPIRDVNGAIIGILYVGILEKPFSDITRNVLFVLVAIVLFSSILAAVLGYVLAATITSPLTQMLEATSRISGGELEFRVENKASVKELEELARSFNEMASKLHERDMSLKVSSDKLAELNKSYLDLIGFVAHELKNILSSTILNAYTVRDGFLGMVNFKQRKALDSITRNLDYFASTIKNFLNLSRIEKQELSLKKGDLSVKDDIFNISLEALMREANEKNIRVTNSVPAGLRIKGDSDLLQIVANNLIANAVKYGQNGGRIIVSAVELPESVKVEVYNDARPIQSQDSDKLFQKFSRLNYAENKKERGTGLGLFITKEIIEKHGGRIWVEPRSEGNAFIFELAKV
ncbi:MAG: cache domain-containing protein [Candidatus Omnitrophota bacterium]